MNVRINLDELLGDFKFTTNQLNELKKITSKALAIESYHLAVEQAGYKLHTSYNAYVDALSVVEVEQGVYALKLSGSKLAMMLENGATAFDIKAGFKLSSKVKYNKSGEWYLTVPMLFKTPGVSLYSIQAGKTMSRKIYDLIRQQPVVKVEGSKYTSRLSAGDVPAKYDPVPKDIPALFQIGSTLEQYTPKSSIYAGLQRVKDITTNSSTYNTFRRVSENSSKNSWLHPGLQAMNIMDDATKLLDSDKIVGEIIKKML